MMEPDAILVAKDLSIGYGNGRHGSNVLLTIPEVALRRGELTGLLGPNGSGKSTLIRTLCNLQSALSGEIRLGGQPLYGMKQREQAQRLSLVLTERTGGGNLSVYEVVALGRIPYTDWFGTLGPIDRRMIERALDLADVSRFRDRKLFALSDGERQKVMLARALAQDTPLIILDEPTAHLDLPNRIDMMQLLRKLAGEAGKAILISSHELDLTLQSADQLWLLSDRQLIAGTPEDLVLNGTFQSVFRHTGVRFDVLSGSFLMDKPVPSEYIFLTGEASATYWLGRALLREGWGIAENAQSACQISVHADHPGYTFRARWYDEVAVFRSVEALLKWFRGKIRSGV